MPTLIKSVLTERLLIVFMIFIIFFSKTFDIFKHRKLLTFSVLSCDKFSRFHEFMVLELRY